MDTLSPAWWTTLYDDHLADVLLDAAEPAETEATATFLERVLHLAPGARVFDQCCGTGRVSIALARRGHHVLGVDLVERYVERARRAAAGTLPAPRFEAADAFEYRAPQPCDGGFNWWTSFGYAGDDATNARMLAQAAESIRAGGRYALDFHNAAAVLRRFQRDVITRRTTPAGELTLLRESHVDLRRGRLDKRWTFLFPDGHARTHDSSVRLYSAVELVQLFEGQGFEDVQLYGDLDGSPLTLDSPRCIVVGAVRGR